MRDSSLEVATEGVRCGEKPGKEQRRAKAGAASAPPEGDPVVHSIGRGEPQTVVVVIGRLFSVPPEAGTPRPFHLLTHLRDRARLLDVAVVADPEPVYKRFVEQPEIMALFDRSWLFHRRTSSSALAHVRTLVSGRPPFDVRYKNAGTLASVHRFMDDLVRDEGPLVFIALDYRHSNGYRSSTGRLRSWMRSTPCPWRQRAGSRPIDKSHQWRSLASDWLFPHSNAMSARYSHASGRSSTTRASTLSTCGSSVLELQSNA